MASPSETKVLTAHIPLGLADKVDALAARLERSRGWIIKQALTDWVALEEERDRLRQDTLAAWEDYENTGLHLTAEEADAWLAKLEAGEDADPPECHR